MRFSLMLAAFALLTSAAQAEIVTREMTYRDGDVMLKGYLAYDDKNAQSKSPGVMLVPEWWGQNEYIKRRTREMAELGYVAFAVDMYGDGKVTKDAGEAGAWSGAFYKDGALMRTRAQAGLNVLKGLTNVDKKNIAAIGFCFGGTVAIELARQGEELKGVAGFHAGLQFPDEAKTSGIKAKILVLNGAADPMVPASQQQAFISEMEKTDADLQFVLYGNAQHAFTNPDADSFGLKGVAYNAQAEKRSLEALKQFFAEIFPPAAPAKSN